MAYSFSQIQTYLKCPLSYKYRYIDEIIPPKEDSLELILWNTVHKSLEYLYKQINVFKTPNLETLLEYFDTIFDKEIENKNFEQNDIENFQSRWKYYLKKYYENNKPFDQNKILAIESNINFELQNWAKFRWKIDRLDINNDKIIVIDYKTNKTLPPDDNQNYNEQIILYSYWVLQKYWKQFKNISWKIEFLHFEYSKNIEINQDILNNTIKKYTDIINEIEFKKSQLKNWNENVFDAKESWLCRFCAYQQICPLFAHSFWKISSEDLSEDTIKTLIDNYVSTKNKIKELEKQIEWTKQILIDFANKNNLKRLFWKQFKITISQREDYKILNEQWLKTILEKQNLLNEVLKLDKFKIARLIKENKINIQKLDKYLDKNIITTLRGSVNWNENE